jgi:hypothetical protein
MLRSRSPATLVGFSSVVVVSSAMLLSNLPGRRA